MSGVEVVVGARALVGESPIWDTATQTLVWVDIPRGEVHRYAPDTDRDTSIRLDCPVGAALPRRGGGLVLAAGLGVALLDETRGRLDWLATGARGDRMNDAACDPAGRLWAGTLTCGTTGALPGAAALYRLDGDVLTLMLDAGVSNGLGWSPDGGTLYYADTVTERVDAFDFQVDTGALSRRRPFVDLHEVPGRPDGLTVDAEGGVWVAMARGGVVRRFDPDATLQAVIEVGTPTVTSCGFGGPGMRDLYVTTLCTGLSEAELAEHPRAGALLRIPDVGVAGLPVSEFGG